MWGRKKRDQTQTVVEPTPSYWSTHPEPTQQTQQHLTTPLPHNTVVSSVSVTVNGKPVDLSSPDGHHLITVLAKSGKLTEHHVYQSTQHANPEQQKRIMDLLLQRQSGTISDPDFAARLIEVMKS